MKLNKNLISVIVFPLVGLASAFLAIRTKWTQVGLYNFLGSIGFGFLMSICFWIFAGLRSLWRTVAFILISNWAAVLAFFLSAFLATSSVGHNLGYPPKYLLDKCVGGYAGAFVLISAMLLLLARDVRVLMTILKSAAWAVSGTIFAAIATELTDQFYPIRQALDIHQTEEDIALMIVWQTGMALILALVLWAESTRLRNEPLRSAWWR